MPATTSVSLPLLDRVQTASPCDVRWDQMTPEGEGDRTRRCERCSLSVHNIAQMTRAEAEAFLASRFDESGQPLQHRVCALIYRRADGTIITADCPVGLAKLRAAARRTIYRVAAVLGLTAVTAAAAAAFDRAQHAPLSASQPFAAVGKLIGKGISYRPPIAGGLIAVPPPAPSKPGTTK